MQAIAERSLSTPCLHTHPHCVPGGWQQVVDSELRVWGSECRGYKSDGTPFSLQCHFPLSEDVGKLKLRKNRAGHHNGGVCCLNQCLSRKSWACRWKKLITVTEAAFTLTKVRLCGCGPRQEYTLMVNILSQTTHYYYIIKRYIRTESSRTFTHNPSSL